MTETRAPADSAGVVLIFGKRRSGKSWLGRLLAEEASRQNRKVIVHDPTYDWWRWGFRARGCHVFSGPDYDAEYVSQIALLNPPSTIIYDELAMVLDQKGRYWSESALEIAQRGRHDGVGFVGISQRPQSVSLEVRDLWTSCYLFHITGGRGQSWIDENISEGAGKLSGDLQPLEFVHIID